MSFWCKNPLTKLPSVDTTLQCDQATIAVWKVQGELPAVLHLSYHLAHSSALLVTAWRRAAKEPSFSPAPSHICSLASSPAPADIATMACTPKVSSADKLSAAYCILQTNGNTSYIPSLRSLTWQQVTRMPECPCVGLPVCWFLKEKVVSLSGFQEHASRLL